MSPSTPSTTTTTMAQHTTPQPTSSSSTLECGTSLSERAHYYYDDDDDDGDDTEQEQRPRKEEQEVDSNDEEKKESNSNETSTTTTATKTTIIEKREAKAKSMMSKMMMKDGDKHSLAIKTIHELRSMIASDVLCGKEKEGKTEGLPLQFSSPFEDMFEKQRLKQLINKQQQHVNTTTNVSSKNYLLPLIYCDQTASNRPISSIETYLQQVCLPLLGNTHTNTSITGSQSTAFCAEARQLIAELTNAKITGKASTDIVLFA